MALALAAWVSYALATRVLGHATSISHADDLLGGMWAAVASVFVYRLTFTESVTAALTRISATLVSLALCLGYLLVLPFHPWAMAMLVGVGAFALSAARRPGDVITAGITTVVVMVVAALSPRDAWEEPILRLADTAVGTVVALVGAMVTSASPLSHADNPRP